MSPFSEVGRAVADVHWKSLSNKTGSNNSCVGSRRLVLRVSEIPESLG